MNEQQEFLECLKDPTKALFNDAIKEILSTFPNKITDVNVNTYPETADYIILLYALDSKILLDTEAECIDIICGHVQGLMVSMTDHPIPSWTKPGYFKCFYASWEIK